MTVEKLIEEFYEKREFPRKEIKEIQTDAGLTYEEVTRQEGDEDGNH